MTLSFTCLHDGVVAHEDCWLRSHGEAGRMCMESLLQGRHLGKEAVWMN